MPKSKHHPKIIMLALMFISTILIFPKLNNIENVLLPILSNQEFDLFINNKGFFIFLMIILELIGALITILILKYIYLFAKIPLSLTHNAILYFTVSIVSKLISIIIPTSILSVFPLLNSFIYSLVFILVHYLYDKQKSNTKTTWLVLSIYPIFNIFISFL